MDLIPLDQDAQKAGVGRTTLFRWLGQGLLDRDRRRGDRRTLIDRDQLRA